MPVLFVHGVPATARLWRPILDLIDRSDEVEAVDLPGFATEPPAGWVAQKENYVDFVIERLEALHARGGPVHLVGHDWGCLLTLRAASLRPELLRSVAAGNAPIDEHWPLHNMWDEWMVPGEGEALMDRIVAAGGMAEMLQRLGFPPEDAKHNGWAYPGNGRRILSLYRSAIDIGRAWAPDLARIVIPSMLLWGERDLIVPIEIGRRMAAKIGAEVVPLPAGHFWPYEAPKEAVAALTRHWKRAELIPYTILTQPRANP
jgi:pimeloyl-ACP methyl ester carboxylesterase